MQLKVLEHRTPLVFSPFVKGVPINRIGVNLRICGIKILRIELSQIRTNTKEFVNPLRGFIDVK